MSRTVLVYVIIFTASFAYYINAPLTTEYLYKKVADAHNVTRKKQTCDSDHNNTDVEIAVTSEVSRLTLILTITMLLPASIVTIVITSWGDRVGRKVTMGIPSLGLVICGIVFSLILYFDWPVEMIFIGGTVIGITGSPSTLLIQAAAYIGDITPIESRGKKFMILEAGVGVGAGIAGITTGYWIDARGFFEPTACATALYILSFALIFFLPDSLKIRDQRIQRYEASPAKFVNETNGSLANSNGVEESDSKYGSCSKPKPGLSSETEKYTFGDLLRSVWRLYTSDYSHCVESNGTPDSKKTDTVKCKLKGSGFPGRVWRLWLYVLSENIFEFVLNGLGMIQVIYFLAEPLCFTPLLVGAQQSLKFALYALSPLLVIVCERFFSLSNNAISSVGLVGLLAYSVMLGLATSPVLVFIGTGAIFFINTTRPFILAQISKIVLETEQGSAYALLNFTETIFVLTGSISFLLLYPATLRIFTGFIWLFGAVVLLIPIFFIAFISVKDSRRNTPTTEETQPLIT